MLGWDRGDPLPPKSLLKHCGFNQYLTQTCIQDDRSLILIIDKKYCL